MLQTFGHLDTSHNRNHLVDLCLIHPAFIKKGRRQKAEGILSSALCCDRRKQGFKTPLKRSSVASSQEGLNPLLTCPFCPLPSAFFKQRRLFSRVQPIFFNPREIVLGLISPNHSCAICACVLSRAFEQTG
jgi:hypothetical protein